MCGYLTANKNIEKFIKTLKSNNKASFRVINECDLITQHVYKSYLKIRQSLSLRN